jgi:hypothetical protein
MEPLPGFGVFRVVRGWRPDAKSRGGPYPRLPYVIPPGSFFGLVPDGKHPGSYLDPGTGGRPFGID